MAVITPVRFVREKLMTARARPLHPGKEDCPAALPLLPDSHLPRLTTSEQAADTMALISRRDETVTAFAFVIYRHRSQSVSQSTEWKITILPRSDLVLRHLSPRTVIPHGIKFIDSKIFFVDDRDEATSSPRGDSLSRCADGREEIRTRAVMILLDTAAFMTRPLLVILTVIVLTGVRPVVRTEVARMEV